MTTITDNAPRILDDINLYSPASVPKTPLKSPASVASDDRLTLDAHLESFTYEKLLKERAMPSDELQAYGRLRDTVAAETFDLSALAKSFIQQEVKKKTHQEIDPDQVYLHNFGMSAISSPTAFTGWEHYDKPVNSCTLTELVLRNFNAQAQEKDDATLNMMYGVYRDGPGQSFYGVSNEVPITASDLRKIIWDGDFEKKATEKLSKFWKDHETDVRTLGRARFIGAAKLAKSEGQLSEADYGTVMKGGAPRVPVSGPVTLAELQATATTDASVSVRRLDINGYASSDILLFKDEGNGREILYMPGERQPFHAFKDDLALRQWIAEQGKDAETSLHLISHFSLYERQDGLIFSGVENSLEKLGLESWPVSGNGINRNDGVIHGDVFDEVVQKTKARSFQDTDTLVTSNSEVKKNIWLGYLRVANQVFSPLLALVGGPAGAAVGASAFMAQLGLETDQVVQGDTAFERRQGAIALGADIGMALLFGVLTASPKESEMPPWLSNEEANEIPRVEGLAQRLHKLKTQGLGGLGALGCVRGWARQVVRNGSLNEAYGSGEAVAGQAEFLFSKPKISIEARNFLHHVMDEGLLIDDAIEQALTEINVDLTVHSAKKGGLVTLSSGNVGFRNFVTYHGENYLRFLDRLFLLETKKDPVHYFVVKSALSKHKALCTLVPELRVNEHDKSTSVVLKEAVLERIEKSIGKVRYYGIDPMKNVDPNVYDYLMISLQNARTLLKQARERLSVMPLETELEDHLASFGISNLTLRRREIVRKINGCDAYLATLEGTCRDRVIVIEKPKEEPRDIAFTLEDDPVKRLYLHAKFFESRTLDAATTLIHEASHLAAGTSDLWYAPGNSYMMENNATFLNKYQPPGAMDLNTQFQMDAASSKKALKLLTIENAEGALKSGLLLDENFIRYVKQKMFMAGSLESAPKTIQEAINIFNADPDFKTSVILHNADSFSQLVAATASSSFFKGEISLANTTTVVDKEWISGPSKSPLFDASLPGTSQASHASGHGVANEKRT